MRVFWPTAGLTKDEGVVAGWRIEDTLCVVGIVEEWMANKLVQDAKPIEEHGTTPLTTLGRARAPRHTEISAESDPNEITFWLGTKGVPFACSVDIELMLYIPPDPGRLRFLTLGATDKARMARSDLAQQDVYSIGAGRRGGDKTLERIINLINRSKLAQSKLDQLHHSPESKWVRPRGSTAMPRISPLSLVAMALLPVRLWSQAFINAASRPVLRLPPLRGLSCTVEQICLRLQQALDGPEQFRGTRMNIAIEKRSERYMQFWNTVWLVANDLILGYWTRIVILQAVPLLVPIAGLYSTYLVETPILALRWLNDWPVGLKLNTPLSQFFCSSLGGFIQSWGDIITSVLHDIAPRLLIILAASSLGGLALSLSVLRDLLSLVTLHLYACYRVMSLVYQWQASSLGGLWNLFRGKRWNVLRQRTDSYEYDVDQLFLGTLLFTVSAFLFPTVLTYAALFGLIRSFSVAMQMLFGHIINALNAFPLFEIMLRLKEPSRLPAGVQMRLVHLEAGVDRLLPDDAALITRALEVKSCPKSLMDILWR
ncbi:hypothetical protein IAR55_002499 [Kwoniella newhampshirensis]|uniref:Phosphatidylinositol glycan, class Q n=1 Tax=Kwoniella newhampshirensis TaxID=1651941 RepID=A0AAW0Z1M5_9TREE